MDTTGVAALIVAITGAIGTLITGIAVAWKWAKTIARESYLREQSAKTIRELEAENTELRAENKRLRSPAPEKLI